MGGYPIPASGCYDHWAQRPQAWWYEQSVACDRSAQLTREVKI
ncbi:MAG: hypothetical protein AB2541_15505 [Candidatus Thiodiazotropha sp.]